LAALLGGIDGSGREHGKIDDGIADAMELPTLKFTAKPLLPQCFGRDRIYAMFSERSLVSEGYSARVRREHSIRSSSQPMSMSGSPRGATWRALARKPRALCACIVDAVLKQASSITAKGSTSS
jgi:hypothetical protein